MNLVQNLSSIYLSHVDIIYTVSLGNFKNINREELKFYQEQEVR